MKSLTTNPAHWRLSTLLSIGTPQVHELARRAVGTLTSYRLILGRCLLAMHQSKGYKEHGCSSAIHYACSVLGLPARMARGSRRVANCLQNLPELSLAAELGTIPWSKLREITRKASPNREIYWLELSKTRNYKEIEALVKRTPNGSIPGEVADDDETYRSELRCALSPEVFAMLEQARRAYSLEKDEAVTNAQVLEWALASYLSHNPADPEALNKARAKANKDLQAEAARQLPVVIEARELALEMGLLGEPNEEPKMTRTDQAPSESSVYSESSQSPQSESQAWQNPRLNFNTKSRHTSKAQKEELLRRDGWCCQTPGCQHKVWLHLHHLHSYADGGETCPHNLVTACSACHLNIHRGILNISQDPHGKLIFSDQRGRRLDRQANLEMAGWLDFWLGWSGKEEDSHQAQFEKELWAVFA